MEKTSVDNLNTLFKSFKIKATCVDAFKHRHFSYYDVKLEAGTKITSLSKYAEELSLELQARSALIVNPIPSKGIVRLRTTHAAPTPITVEELYQKHGDSPPEGILPFLIGETDEGEPLWMDMSLNPHLLVAGATGSGKSTLLHNIIENAARRTDAQLWLIDTKIVEFRPYRKTFMKGKVRYHAQSYEEAILLLERLEIMMDRTYEYLAENNMQSIEDKPELFRKQIVLVDEVADLMSSDKKEKRFEELLTALAQKARAAGIYLVVGTQRPSVDVLTGLIKSNFPARVACRCSTKIDSRVILDEQGAENLAGRGDAILKLPSGDMTRFQVGFASSQSVKQVIENGC